MHGQKNIKTSRMSVNKQRQQEEIAYDALLIPAVKLFLNNQFKCTVDNS
jgi:hypothetical protein